MLSMNESTPFPAFVCPSPTVHSHAYICEFLINHLCSFKSTKATDVRLAAIGLGTGSRGGLGELAVNGNCASKVTDFGLKAVARCSPSRTSLTLWTLSSVGDAVSTPVSQLAHKIESMQIPRREILNLVGIESVIIFHA
ncbi:hypothetical protein Tco_0557397 [Tanacetum coccineum]